MRVSRICAAIASTALAFTLVACSAPASYMQESLDDVSGVKVTAENADSDMSALTEGAITVEDGDVIVVSPLASKGSFHLTITPTDSEGAIYDEDVSGKVSFSIEAEPGTYDVNTSGNKVTGEMTVFAQSADELAEQNASLSAALEQQGVDHEKVQPNE